MRPILVVEDDPAIRSLICSILEAEDLPVESVGDGAAAISWLSLRKPRLVVLDMNMPGTNGEDVAVVVRRRYDDAVPVVVVTADWQADERAKAIGATRVIRKPFDLDALIEVVATSMNADARNFAV